MNFAKPCSCQSAAFFEKAQHLYGLAGDDLPKIPKFAA